MRRQEGPSDARRNAECSPRLSGLRSLSIVRSQDWRGRPLGRRQSLGRWSVDARSAHEWSSEAVARAICPNSLSRRCCISKETGGWLELQQQHIPLFCCRWNEQHKARCPCPSGQPYAVEEDDGSSWENGRHAWKTTSERHARVCATVHEPCLHHVEIKNS